MTELKDEAESGELVVIKEVDIPALFKKDGCDPIIEGLKKKAAEFEGDISTAKGRKEIASFAAKFSTSKVHIDKLGKALTDKLRDDIAPIQTERNKIKTCCDELRDKIREPLTKWEDDEKERVKNHEAAIQFINNHLEVEFEDSAHVARLLEMVNGVIVDEALEEFELAGRKAKEDVVERLKAKFIVLQAAEKEKAEADRLEKERLAKEQEEREAKIAEDAAEAARIETVEKAKAEAEEKELEEKEKREKLEKETLQAQLDKEKAEREKKEAEALAEKEKKEAAEQAERNKEIAIEDERKRVAAIKEDERIADEKLAKNKAHRGKLNKEAKQSFIDEGFEAEEAERIIKVIAKGRIANITINYGA